MTDARAFRGFRFPAEVILRAVRWYLQFPISYRDLERMLADRGVAVDHASLYRWVQRFAPQLEKRLRRHLRPCRGPWHVDETYIRVDGEWRYLLSRQGIKSDLRASYKAAFDRWIDWKISSTAPKEREADPFEAFGSLPGSEEKPDTTEVEGICLVQSKEDGWLSDADTTYCCCIHRALNYNIPPNQLAFVRLDVLQNPFMLARLIPSLEAAVGKCRT